MTSIAKGVGRCRIHALFMESRAISLFPNSHLVLGKQKNFSTSTSHGRSYKLLVVGGGAGGSLAANKFASQLGAQNVAVVEPSEDHYYQPMWTLVGGGIKTLEQSQRSTESILPKGCDWIKDKAAAFDPENCTVTTEGGEVLGYDYLVVALGLQLHYDKIKGLPEAFDEDPMVCSNYSPMYVQKTWQAAQKFDGGNAIFTYPNSPIKCAGAPQKICYLLEEFFREKGVRDKTKIIYNTSLPAIFGIPRYAAALRKVAESRNIEVNFKRNLIEVRPETKEAVFEILESEGKTETVKYSFLHVSPPMSAPSSLKQSPLVDGTGFLDVNRGTLQHKKYPNVFGIGDCLNTPNAKTAAAVAAQGGVLGRNLRTLMLGDSLNDNEEYNGYASCPLITGKSKCILAEFGYDGAILETFPVDQAQERKSMYIMKKDLMPSMYWHMLVKGVWNGPGFYRKLMSYFPGPAKV